MDYIINLFKHGIIPEEYADIIPIRCHCGGWLMTNENLSAVTCDNPICPMHMASKAESMLKQLDVAKFGFATCLSIVEENSLLSHLQILALTPDQMPERNSEAVRNSYYSAIHEAMKTPRTLADLAKLMQCKGLQGRADKVLCDYNDLDTFYNELYTKGEQLIADKLDMNVGKISHSFYNYFNDCRPAFYELYRMFPHKQVATQTITVCMTGEVLSVTKPDGSCYRNRESFIADMQAMLEGKLNILVSSSMSMSVDYLITDTPHSNSGKNRKADKYKTPKLTFKDFAKICDNYLKSIEKGDAN